LADCEGDLLSQKAPWVVLLNNSYPSPMRKLGMSARWVQTFRRVFRICSSLSLRLTLSSKYSAYFRTWNAQAALTGVMRVE
jgi:hypothetical protein